MIKKILGLVLFAGILVSCGSTENKEEATDTVAGVEFTSLIENPTDFIDKDISIEGKVVHVCTHSGKKMFIVGENPDIRLFISAGEELPKFPLELLGSTISVSGKLAMVETGEKMGEGEHKEGEHKEGAEKEHKEGAEETAEGEDCETEAAVAAQPALANYVLHYTSHLEK